MKNKKKWIRLFTANFLLFILFFITSIVVVRYMSYEFKMNLLICILTFSTLSFVILLFFNLWNINFNLEKKDFFISFFISGILTCGLVGADGITFKMIDNVQEKIDIGYKVHKEVSPLLPNNITYEYHKTGVNNDFYEFYYQLLNQSKGKSYLIFTVKNEIEEKDVNEVMSILENKNLLTDNLILYFTNEKYPLDTIEIKIDKN